MASIINWVFYLFGIFLVLFPKVRNFGRQNSYAPWKAFVEFFIGDGEAYGVTASSLAAYFVLGSWYFGLIYWNEPQSIIPIHWSASFFIGTLSELTAPVISDQFVKAIKVGISRLFGDGK